MLAATAPTPPHTPAVPPRAASGSLARDVTASIVVFLVAMPLCMGIAVASGVPPEKGLLTGIIGGLVVGFLAGSPLQVSGPAAGLAVIVYDLIHDHGVSALGPILLLAGAIQLLAGVLRLGGWFRAISPAVVHGMLAGIGVLIVAGQSHVVFDAKPLANGVQNLLAIPGRLLGLDAGNLGRTETAFLIGLLTIGAMLGWEKLRPASLKLVPGALLGVVAAALFASIGHLDIARVVVPANFIHAFDAPDRGFWAAFADPGIYGTALALAFIASAETLLSAAAVDRMHNGVRTNYDKELRAQGVGNLLCGLAGALPMTGVIVRSSANVQAGAETRRSTIFHGAWILGFVTLLPWLLREIPMAALGGILVVTGWRLVNLRHVTHLFHRYGVLPALIWAATLATVVMADLLTGVLVGMALSLLELAPYFRSLKLGIHKHDGAERSHVRLNGSATFLTLPKLTRALEGLPPTKPVTLDVDRLTAIDHTSAELLGDWIKRRGEAGSPVELLGGAERLHTLTA